MTNLKPMPFDNSTKHKLNGLLEFATSMDLVTARARLWNVSTVSEAFPGVETGFSAYLRGKPSTVSVFPPFPTLRRGYSRG